MTTSQHTSTAILLSKLSGNSFIAFIIGFLSHFILDIIEPQEYRSNMLSFDDIDYKLTEIILTVTLLIYTNSYWIILGALLPDIIEAILVLFDRERYNTGNHFFWFHRGQSKREMTKRQTIILSFILFILAFRR